MDVDIDEKAVNSKVAGPSSGIMLAEGEESSPKLSKNAMKKAAKLAHRDALKPQRRAAEKIRRRERVHALAEKYNTGALTAEERAAFEKRKQLKAKKRADKGHSGEEWRGGVIVDLDFDELMTDIEISSMVSQLGHLYSCNRMSPRPFSTILHTSFSPTASPRLWDKMAKAKWEKWTRSYWWAQGMEDVVKAFHPTQETVNVPVTASSSSIKNASKSAKHTDLLARLTGPILPPAINSSSHQVVYLSADADEELSVLSENEIYVIGGIVDRNRHKMLCQNKATALGVRTARLPIGTYLANLPTRKVLTVNQVFEILAQYVALSDWAKAFDAVIPPRKYQAIGRQGQRRQSLKGSGSKDGEGEADGDGDSDGGESEQDKKMDEDMDEEAAVNNAC